VRVFRNFHITWSNDIDLFGHVLLFQDLKIHFRTRNIFGFGFVFSKQMMPIGLGHNQVGYLQPWQPMDKHHT
jgi:hypothetical protein